MVPLRVRTARDAAKSAPVGRPGAATAAFGDHAAVIGDADAAGAWFCQRTFSTVLPKDEDGDEDEDEDEDGDCSIRTPLAARLRRCACR